MIGRGLHAVGSSCCKLLLSGCQRLGCHRQITLCSCLSLLSSRLGRLLLLQISCVRTHLVFQRLPQHVEVVLCASFCFPQIIQFAFCFAFHTILLHLPPP